MVVETRLRVLARGEATPDRLRRVGVVLALACLLAGLVSLVSGSGRSADTAAFAGRIGALTADAAGLYHALADADAMATSGYVSGGVEPADVLARYDADVQRAASLLVGASGKLAADDPATAQLAVLTEQLPVYTALMATARTYNRLGLPLGQSYLSSASRLMSGTLLPAAAQLRAAQLAELRAADARGGAFPFAPLLVLLGALAAVVDVGVRELRRTNRVLSPGLVVCGASLVLAVLWWLVASIVSEVALGAAEQHAHVATVLDDVGVAVLQARSNESLVLVARSGGSTDSEYGASMKRADELLADVPTDAAAARLVAQVRDDSAAWQAAHGALRAADDAGRYEVAVASATGHAADSSGGRFDRLDADLATALDAERRAFAADAATASAALTGIAVGPAVLALIAAAGAVAGIGARIGEYR